MVRLTQSMREFLTRNYPEKIGLILFGHVEEFTKDMEEEYIAWLKTDDGRSYLEGGANYK